METTPMKVTQTENKKEKRKPRKKRHLIRKLVITLLILAILAGAGWYLISSLQAQYTVTYQPYSATIGTISNSLSFNGTLQTINSASYSANNSGTVKTIYVSAGDSVKKGDRLIRLSTGQIVEAEFDGVINEINVAEGDTVKGGETLCQVVDFIHMKTSIRVDEYDINDVHVGDAVRVVTTANNKTFDATIAAINHVSSSGSSVAYYTATAYVDVEDGVWPGMQVSVTLPQEEAADVVILKMDAISFDEQNRAFVYMKDENGEMQENLITTGVSNGSYTEIKSGLKDGDTVYTEVTTEASSPLTSLLSGLFSQTKISGMPGSSGRGSRSSDGTSSFGSGSGFDFSNMPQPGSSSGGSGSGSGGFGGFGGGSR